MVDRTGLRPTTDGSAGSKDIADKYMIETYPKQYESVIESLPPIPEPPKPEPPKPSKPSKPSSTPKPSKAAPSHIKHYNPDHNEFESPFYDNTEEKVEETPTLVEESSANIIEDVVITSFEAVGTGLIKVSSASHFKSHIDDALKLNRTAFAVVGVGVDFIDELQDGNGVLGAAILAAGHFATTAVINMVLSATFIWLGIPSIFIIPATIIISSIIITYVDSRYMA